VLTIETYENRTVTPIAASDNSVQSMILNPRITVFPYSNIQENLTIFVYGRNEKNWYFDLYCDV
jgi:hypothetical protein